MELRLDGLHHGYGNIEVLRGIDLDIPAGRVVCIVGPSGCGKSTLLRLIGGLELPDRGSVIQIGEPPGDSLNPLTYIFQDFALLPWRTVEGNVRLVLEDHGFARDESARIVAVCPHPASNSQRVPAATLRLMKHGAIARALAVCRLSC